MPSNVRLRTPGRARRAGSNTHRLSARQRAAKRGNRRGAVSVLASIHALEVLRGVRKGLLRAWELGVRLRRERDHCARVPYAAAVLAQGAR